jgi:hypothetical protein
MVKKSISAVLILLFSSLPAFSQVSIKDSAIFTTLFFGNYSYMFPGGDLAKRYGGTSEIGGGILFKTRSNWLIGGEGNYMFGGTVHNEDDILKNIATANGFVIDANGYLADILFSERGFNFYGKFGKVIPVLAPNPNCGLALVAGIGYLQNKIRIHNPGNTAPQVYGDYRKGYDHLNSGFSVTGSAGYLYLGNSRLLNFFLGFEFTQAWTTARRDSDFDTGMKDTKKYSSQWYGIRVNWMIPLYKRKPKEFYLY